MEAAAEHFFRLMLWNPRTQFELLLSATLAAMTFVLVLNKVGSALDLKLAETMRSLVVLAVGLTAVLAALGFLSLQPGLPRLVIPVAAIVLVLAVVTPLACLLLKGPYLSALFSLLISMAAATVMILFIHTTFSALNKSGTSVDHGRQHRRDVERAMDL